MKLRDFGSREVILRPAGFGATGFSWNVTPNPRYFPRQMTTLTGVGPLAPVAGFSSSGQLDGTASTGISVIAALSR